MTTNPFEEIKDYHAGFEDGKKAGKLEAVELVRELVTAFLAVKPVALVSGDATQHLNPRSRLMLNSNAAWLVTAEDKTAHKMRMKMEKSQEALTKANKWLEENE